MPAPPRMYVLSPDGPTTRDGLRVVLVDVPKEHLRALAARASTLAPAEQAVRAHLGSACGASEAGGVPLAMILSPWRRDFCYTFAQVESVPMVGDVDKNGGGCPLAPEVRPITAHYSPAEVERIASEAARLALALVKPPVPEPAPRPELEPELEPETVDTAEAARRMRKTRKTIREYLRLAPQGAFAWKYGRDWSIDYRLFEAWVRGGGPRLAAQAFGHTQGRVLASQEGGFH